MSPRSSSLPKNWIYRYALPCSCVVLDLFACVCILVYAWCQIPGCQDSITCQKPTLPCVCWSRLQSSGLCSKRFTKPSSWSLSLTQTTSLLPAYKMLDSHTNWTHPSRHTQRLEQLPRLCFLFHSSPRTVGTDGYTITTECSGTQYLFTDGHQRHLMLPGDAWPFPPLTATTPVSVTLVFWKF